MSATTIRMGSLLTVQAPARISVVQAVDPSELAVVLEIRRRVFAVEQRAAGLRVADADDARSVIALASIEQDGACRPAATGRLTLPVSAIGQGVIAWVATIPEARGEGAGGAVMRFLLDAADRARTREVVLAAQAPAERFYRALGFRPAGPVYDVRGIAHRRMVRLRPR